MPHLETAQDWLKQSSLLMQARPSTTRISTKYTLISAEQTKSKRRTKTKAPPAPTGALLTDPYTPRATLELKTHDSASGVTLKYQTNKAQEVSRLVASMGRLGRGMARLPELAEDSDMKDIKEDAVEGMAIASGVATPIPAAAPAVQQGGGGGKKKKKGKK